MKKTKILSICLAASLLTSMLGAVACGGETPQESSTPKHVHAWGEGETVEEGACEAHGRVKYTCECGETRTEVVPAFGHDLPMNGTISKEPTCTEDGVETYTCRVCGEGMEKKLNAIGHSYVLGEAVDGYAATICASCNDECLGERQYALGEEVPLLGLWEVTDGIYYGYWQLEQPPAVTVTDEEEHTAGKKAIKVDYTSASLAPGTVGAWAIQIGIHKPVENVKYRLTFYAKASADCKSTNVYFKANTNYFDGSSCTAVTPGMMNPNELVGADWREISVEFTATPQEDYTSFRLETWMEDADFIGQIYYADFSVSIVPQEEV